MNMKKIIETAGLENAVFRGQYSLTKEFYDSITTPDILMILKQKMTDRLAEHILKINEPSFVTKEDHKLSLYDLEIELVILTKEELKRLINVCINL